MSLLDKNYQFATKRGDIWSVPVRTIYQFAVQHQIKDFESEGYPTDKVASTLENLFSESEYIMRDFFNLMTWDDIKHVAKKIEEGSEDMNKEMSESQFHALK
jgi:hypothetical protein